MDKITQELSEKVAAYIEKTQPLLDKQCEAQAAFVKRATQAAGVLANRGVIDQRRVNDFIDKVAADPSSVWEFVEKLAAAMPADALGDAVQTKLASGQKLDPFERIFFGRETGNSGMVD